MRWIVIAIALALALAACGDDAREVGGACTARDDCGDGYCDWPAAHACGRDGAPGACVAVEHAACPDLFDPVCGCDGKTYSNACYAALTRVAIAARGACP